MDKRKIDALVKVYLSVPSMAIFRAVEMQCAIRYVQYLKGDIVDIGCGDGIIAKILFDRRLAVGFDINEKVVRKAKMSDVYQQVDVVDARSLPYQDRSFDGAFSNCVVEHLPEIGCCFREFARVLKPHSYFLFTVVSSHWDQYFWSVRLMFKVGLIGLGKKWLERSNRIQQHLNIWSLERWRAFLREFGFNIVAYEYYMNPRTSFWWSMWDDAYRWPSKLKLLPLLFAKLFNQDRLDKLVEKVISTDHELCTKLNVGVGLLILAKRRV